MSFTFMLTAKSTERNSQPQMKKKGMALLAGYLAFLGAKSKKYVALGVSPDGKGCVREADFLNGTSRKDFGVIDFPNGDALPFVKEPLIMGLPSEVDKKS
jgi:hypothetical protein